MEAQTPEEPNLSSQEYLQPVSNPPEAPAKQRLEETFARALAKAKLTIHWLHLRNVAPHDAAVEAVRRILQNMPRVGWLSNDATTVDYIAGNVLRRFWNAASLWKDFDDTTPIIDGHFAQWLRKAARHAVADYIRSNRRHFPPASDLDSLEREGAKLRDEGLPVPRLRRPDQTLVLGDLYEFHGPVVVEALKSLSETQRSVLWLYFFGFSYPDMLTLYLGNELPKAEHQRALEGHFAGALDTIGWHRDEFLTWLRRITLPDDPRKARNILYARRRDAFRSFCRQMLKQLSRKTWSTRLNADDRKEVANRIKQFEALLRKCT